VRDRAEKQLARLPFRSRGSLWKRTPPGSCRAPAAEAITGLPRRRSVRVRAPPPATEHAGLGAPPVAALDQRPLDQRDGCAAPPGGPATRPPPRSRAAPRRPRRAAARRLTARPRRRRPPPRRRRRARPRRRRRRRAHPRRQPGRRPRWRRDDARDLGLDQGEADPPVPRPQDRCAACLISIPCCLRLALL
jgi:hypothetical protein